MAAPSQKLLDDNKKRVADDQQRCQNKFFPTFEQAVKKARKQRTSEPDRTEIDANRAAAAAAMTPEVAGTRASNDAMLPAARRSEIATMTEAFCRRGSWTTCATCHMLRHRPFQAMDARREPFAEITKCTNCKSKNPHQVPQPEDVPPALRGLTKDIIKALRPLDADPGVYERASQGYRVHTSMMRFAWAEHTVAEKIASLHRGGARKKAKKAYRYLMDAEGSAYKDFVKQHEAFLATYPDANEQKRKRPWRFIEEPALENAVWPHLYWKRSMCESVVRFTDVRRLARKGRKARARTGYWRRAEEADACHDHEEEDAEDTEDDADGDRDQVEEGAEREVVDDNIAQIDGDAEGRHSAKASFMAKVLSPLLGYGDDEDLAQYVYDLNMWSGLGGCKNANKQTPLRVLPRPRSVVRTSMSHLYFLFNPPEAHHSKHKKITKDLYTDGAS